MGIQANKKMIFTACAWNDEAAAMIAPLVCPMVADGFRRDIETGKSMLWCITGDDWKTWLVTRLEVLDGGHIELVLGVIAGKHARAIVSELKQNVKKLGVKSMRFETHHSEKVATRLVGCLGFNRMATIFRADL